MKAKTTFFGLMMILLTASCGSTNPELERLEKREDLLELKTELNQEQINYEREKINNDQLKAEVEKYNKVAETETAAFNSGMDPNIAIDQAKEAQKALKKAESVNKDLQKSNKELKDINEKIMELTQEIKEMEATLKQ